MSASLLEVAELNTVLDQFGEKRPLPSNSSKTIRFVREEKLAVAATPTQLTEGIPPDALGIALNQFEAVINENLCHVNLAICWKPLKPFFLTLEE